MSGRGFGDGGEPGNGKETFVLTLALILTFSPRRRNSRCPIYVLRMTVRQIQSHAISRERRMILPLLWERGLG